MDGRGRSLTLISVPQHSRTLIGAHWLTCEIPSAHAKASAIALPPFLKLGRVRPREKVVKVGLDIIFIRIIGWSALNVLRSFNGHSRRREIETGDRAECLASEPS